VVGEDDPGVDMKGVGLTGLFDGIAERGDVVDEEGGASVAEVMVKKVVPPGGRLRRYDGR